MKRSAMHLVAICSAMLALVMLVHWVYSWFYLDGVKVRIGRNEVVIATGQGHARIDINRYVPQAVHKSFIAAEHFSHLNLSNTPLPRAWRTDYSFLGIGIGSAEMRKSAAAYIQNVEQFIKTNTEDAERAKTRSPAGGVTNSNIAAQWQQRLWDVPRFVQMFELPNWLMVLLFGALPAWWFRRTLRERRRQRIGLCPKCGYDLRATPDRCPECGMAPAVGSQTSAQSG